MGNFIDRLLRVDERALKKIEKKADLVLSYEDIGSAVKGKFRLNRKALLVTLKTGEEIIFAVSDKHKKWFALMDEKVNRAEE